MIQFKWFGICVFTCLFLVSCKDMGTNENEDIKTDRTEVLQVFKNQDAINKYFASFDMFMEEYISMVENLIEAGKDVENNGGDMGLDNMMNMMASSTSSLIKMVPLIERMEELENEADILKGDMTQEELEVFMKSYSKLMIRFVEMSEKLD